MQESLFGWPATTIFLLSGLEAQQSCFPVRVLEALLFFHAKKKELSKTKENKTKNVHTNRAACAIQCDEDHQSGHHQFNVTRIGWVGGVTVCITLACHTAELPIGDRDRNIFCVTTRRPPGTTTSATCDSPVRFPVALQLLVSKARLTTTVSLPY